MNEILFKRRKFVQLSYLDASEELTKEFELISDCSFASNENRKDNLYMSELASNLVISMNVILTHSSNKHDRLNPSQKKKLINNTYTCWDTTKHTEYKTSDTDVTVMAFNMLHTIMANIHTAKSKIRIMETNFVEAIKKFNLYFLYGKK